MHVCTDIKVPVYKRAHTRTHAQYIHTAHTRTHTYTHTHIHTHAHGTHNCESCSNSLACVLKATHAQAHMITINMREHVPTAARGHVPSANTQYITETAATHTAVEKVDACSGHYRVTRNRLENEVKIRGFAYRAQNTA